MYLLKDLIHTDVVSKFPGFTNTWLSNVHNPAIGSYSEPAQSN